MSGLANLVEDRNCTAVFTHPAIRRVYKMASHGGAGQSREKQSLNRATVFLQLRRVQNTCHPSFQDGLTNILAQTSCHKQIRAFVCDVRGCNFEAARQLQRRKWMLTTILRRSIKYGSACLRATSRWLRSRIFYFRIKITA